VTLDILHAATQFLTCSTVKNRPRQSNRVFVVVVILIPHQLQASLQLPQQLLFSRAESVRVYVILVELLHRWHFPPSVQSGTVRIRRRGPRLRHIFFSVPLGVANQNKNKEKQHCTRNTRYLPQTQFSRCFVVKVSRSAFLLLFCDSKPPGQATQ
jgi:hypothetical protein